MREVTLLEALSHPTRAYSTSLLNEDGDRVVSWLPRCAPCIAKTVYANGGLKPGETFVLITLAKEVSTGTAYPYKNCVGCASPLEYPEHSHA